MQTKEFKFLVRPHIYDPNDRFGIEMFEFHVWDDIDDDWHYICHLSRTTLSFVLNNEQRKLVDAGNTVIVFSEVKKIKVIKNE